MFRKRTVPGSGQPSASGGNPPQKRLLQVPLGGIDDNEEDQTVIVVDRSKARARMRQGPAGIIATTNSATVSIGEGRIIKEREGDDLDDNDNDEKEDEYSAGRLAERRREMRYAEQKRRLEEGDHHASVVSSMNVEDDEEEEGDQGQARSPVQNRPSEAEAEKQPTILSGEAAEQLMDNDNREDDGVNEVADDDDDEVGPRPSSKPAPSDEEIKVTTKRGGDEEEELPSSPSFSSSGTSEDEEDTSKNKRAGYRGDESGPIAVLEELEQLHDRLKAREVELKHLIAPATTVLVDDRPLTLGNSTIASGSSSTSHKQQAMESLGAKQRKLEALKQYCTALVSCLKLKLHKMKEIAREDRGDDVLGMGMALKAVWSDVAPEFASTESILSRFSFWEQDDLAEFERHVGKEVGELLAPFVLQRFLTQPESVPLQLSEDQYPYLKEATKAFKSEKIQRQVATRAILAGLQNHPTRTEEMAEAFSKLEAQSAAFFSS